jgi:peptide/nickel transport system substrate-binding protein
LGNADLRRALALALDYEGIREAALGGLGDPANALQPPYLGGDQAPIYEAAYAELPELVQDREAAAELVANSGVEDPGIIIAAAAGIDEQTTVALAVQEAAEAIGISAEVREVSLDEFGGLYVPGSDIGKEVDIFFLTDASIVPDPVAFYSYVGLPDGFGNWAGYVNDEVTALLEEASAEPDPDARAELATQAQALIMEDLPFIPLMFRWSVTYLADDLTGAVVAAPATIFYPWAIDLGGQ